MRALLMKPGEAADVMEVMDTEDIEETLGGEADYLWPFEERRICLAVRADREDLEPNRVFEDCGTVRGPILVVGDHDDLDDLTDEEIAFVEAQVSWAEEEYRDDDGYDPYEEDAQEEEDYCGVHIVDEEEFYDTIRGEYL